MSAASKKKHGKNRAEDLLAAIDHAAHYLPDQGPISVFIHHNTLHAFGHLSFHEAIAKATELFGTEPYMSEDEFRRLYAQGRINDQDLAAAIAAGGIEDTRIAGLLGRRELRQLALRHPMAAETPEGLRYRLEEEALTSRLAADIAQTGKTGDSGAARIREQGVRYVRELLDKGSPDDVARALARPTASLEEARRELAHLIKKQPDRDSLVRALARDPEAFAVKALWAQCQRLAPAAEPMRPAQAGFHLGPDGTHRDLLLRLTGEDLDGLVNPVLIRLAAVFLDFGMAYWPMPDRDQGFYLAVRSLFAGPVTPPVPWLRMAYAELRAQAQRGDKAMDVILAALADLGVPHEELETYLTRLLLALPGWAGMMSRLERHPEDRPQDCPPVSLLDFIAVRLVFERAAIAWLARTRLGWNEPLARMAKQLGREVKPQPTISGDHDRTYPLFRLLCAAGVSAQRAAELAPADGQALLAELEAFGELARRRTFQEAYEHHHRREILDAMAEHRQYVRIGRPDQAPRYQVLTCIDDREESLRRHLEELEPGTETFGAAGFFGLAMDFRGIDDAQAVPLCPVVQVPAHEVEEHPHEEDRHLHERRLARRRMWARVSHNTFVGSRSMFRGVFLTIALGLAAAIPMAGRVLFPRLSGRLRRRVGQLLLPQPRTTLRSLREASEAEARSERGKLLGFSLTEKVDRVYAMLTGVGLVDRFAPLVVVLGHGASSVNNPHLSAYDCGACGGRRGGPSARLFAKVANNPEVRAALRERGIDIPDSTWFVGGMHNTTNDDILLSDLDLVPASLSGELAALQALLERARTLDAHERCRRFEVAGPDPSPAEALRHVETRSEHLGEPRPEFGHATNAVCIVGRRSLSRGLFLDRRAFLVSYDPTIDADFKILERTLNAVGPVGAGINLEYYFSYVDNERYGCGNKLPHNVTGLLGVMSGHASDLRTGLPWQMVGIHEPVRLLTIVEARPEALLAVAERQPVVRELVVNRWIQLVSVDPETGAMQVFGDRGFEPYQPQPSNLPVVRSSTEWYRGHSSFLPPARIAPAKGEIAHAA